MEQSFDLMNVVGNVDRGVPYLMPYYNYVDATVQTPGHNMVVMVN